MAPKQDCRGDYYRPGTSNSLSSRRFANPLHLSPKKSSPLNPNRTPPLMYYRPKRLSPLKHSHSPPVQRLKSFKSFGKLPESVQERIFSYLLPGPRVLVASFKQNSDFFTTDKKIRLLYSADAGPWDFGLKSLLHTNQVSRKLVLKLYITIIHSTLSDLPGTRDFYFYPALDTLCLSENDFHKLAWSKGFHALNETGVDETIQNLCLVKYFDDRYKDGTYRQLTRLAGLKKLILNGLIGAEDEKENMKDWHERKLEMEWTRAGKEGRVRVAECKVEIMSKSEMRNMNRMKVLSG